MIASKNMVALFLTYNYEDRYNIGNHHFKMAIAKRFCKAYFFGPEYEGYDPGLGIDELINRYKPDVMFLMFPTRDIENDENLACLDFKRFKGVKVFYDTDSQSSIWPRCEFINKNDINYLFLGNNFKFVEDHKELIENDCQVLWLPFGVNKDFFTDLGRMRQNDLVFLGCTNETHYSNRIHLIAVLKRSFGSQFFFRPDNNINRESYVRVLNEYKIFVSAGDNQEGFFMKYLEAISCGCLLISQYSPCFELLGFIQGKHVVLWEDYNDCVKICRYFLVNDRLRRKIALEGREFVLKHHTWDCRVNEMLRSLKW